MGSIPHIYQRVALQDMIWQAACDVRGQKEQPTTMGITPRLEVGCQSLTLCPSTDLQKGRVLSAVL